MPKSLKPHSQRQFQGDSKLFLLDFFIFCAERWLVSFWFLSCDLAKVLQDCWLSYLANYTWLLAWKLFFIRVYEFYIHFRRALDWWVFGGVVNLVVSFFIALLFLLIVLKRIFQMVRYLAIWLYPTLLELYHILHIHELKNRANLCGSGKKRSAGSFSCPEKILVPERLW